ncbi:hypothetical protein CMUS01_08935 [Colletotrichum musicola]|uniref:Uncharacterized protein n=1 Tax=Colletotrichum musicola TaxID=2175873 RepID=A0A8H6NCJ8_9PEZI|nr:hypothetical protein CMUS01_08935 [Colletotrichum musicola]
MISRAVLARSVCLRCQLRLLDRPRAHSSLRKPTPFRSDLLLRRQYSSQSAWDRLEADSQKEKDERSGSFEKEPPRTPPEAPPEEATTVEQDGDSGSKAAEPAPAAAPTEAPATAPDGTLLFKKMVKKERRDHKFLRSRAVYLESAHLGEAVMLGKRARTVVMREERTQKERKKLPVEEPVVHAPLDINAAIESATGEISVEDALKNIAELRPSDPILSQEEFVALHKVLHDGFTGKQLKAYSERQTGDVQEERPKEEVEYEWLKREAPWVPLQSIAVQGPPKVRLATTIMRDVWRLKIREMVYGEGKLMATLHDRFFLLLARDDKRMSHIRETYLDANESIIPTRNKALSIIATKAKTQTILKKLDEYYQEMVTAHFSASWFPEGSAYAFATQLGLLTKTYITFSRDDQMSCFFLTSDQIHVSWFKNDNAEGAQEPMDQAVRRLLYQAINPRDTSAVLKYDAQDEESKLIYHPAVGEKLAWKDRFRSLCRFVAPTTRGRPRERPGPTLASDILPKPLEAPAQSGDSWSTPYGATTSAFGHILHPYEKNLSLATAAANASHVFSPAAPPPASLAALSEALPPSDDPVVTSLILSFRPHPSLEKETSRSLPGLLQLHIPVPEDVAEGPLPWDASSTRLVAFLDETTVDVAQPAQPIDVRLSQSLQSTMSASALDQSPFREYIEDAKLDLLAGRLNPPAEITISDLPSVKGGARPAEPAKYLFMGLEMRRTLDVEFEGHRLQYSNIQAGLHGGRRAELVLEAAAGGEELARREYVDSVQKLAGGDAVVWVGERPASEEQASSKDTEQAVPEEVEVDEQASEVEEYLRALEADSTEHETLTEETETKEESKGEDGSGESPKEGGL